MSTLKNLWQQPLIRAGLIHLALLGGGWAVAAGIASLLSLSVSVLGILLGYAVVNVALTGWLLRRRKEVEAVADTTADALAEFAEDPLGIVIGDAKTRLAKARKRVGRQAAMYQPLDRLVRLTRKIERRLALEPESRTGFARSLNHDLPLIATTAEQYAGLVGQDPSPSQNPRLILAEAVIREAADRLEKLSDSDGKVDADVIGLIRMDSNAEVLAERMSSDMNGATRRAAAARVSHALRQVARSAEGDLTVDLRLAATRIDDTAAPEDGSLPEDASALMAAAEAQLADPSEAHETVLRGLLKKYL